MGPTPSNDSSIRQWKSIRSTFPFQPGHAQERRETHQPHFAPVGVYPRRENPTKRKRHGLQTVVDDVP